MVMGTTRDDGSHVGVGGGAVAGRGTSVLRAAGPDSRGGRLRLVRPGHVEVASW